MKWKIGLLALVLLCAVLLPGTVGAETVSQGTVGTVTWRLDSDGTLTIGGSGVIGPFDDARNQPWYNDRESIKTLVIQPGVTAIGAWAFSSCSRITSVSIPDSVTFIGAEAFSYCYGLESIRIPDGVVQVVSGAFSLGDIIEITLYASRGSSAARALSKANCKFRQPGEKYSLKYLFSGDTVTGTELALVDTDVEAFTIPSYVTHIGYHAFHMCRIASLTIPSSVVSIGLGAFAECENLKSLVIPDTVTSVGTHLFSGCKSLESAVFPSCVTSLPQGVFSGCSSLKTYSIPDGYTAIGLGAFENCVNLKSVFIPDSVTSIEGAAFRGCKSLEGLTIPDSVTFIGNGAFQNCESLKSIALPVATSFSGALFQGCASLTDVVLPSGMSTLPSGFFIGCTSLQAITLPEGLRSVSQEAFRGCSSLTSVVFPDSLTFIGIQCFDGCVSLKELVFPEGLKTIGGRAFDNCIQLKSLTIPDGLETLGVEAFEGCPAIRYASPDSDAAKLLSRNGYSFRVPGDTFDRRYLFTDNAVSGVEVCGADQDAAALTIPEGMTGICDSAFSGCPRLTRIEIPASVHAFGSDLFPAEPTVYCFEFTDADRWAIDMGYPVVYLDQVDPSEVRTVSLPDDFRMACGASRSVNASVFPAGDHPAVVWESSDPAVVSVQNGVLTAHAPGSAVVTVSAGGASDSVTVTVYRAAESFRLSPEEIWLAAKDPLQITLTEIEPEGADLAVVWSSGDTVFAAVDQSGLVTTYRPGDVIIYAEDENGLRRECLIHLCYRVKTIQFAATGTAIEKDGALQLTAQVTAADGQTYENKLVTFFSSDEAVATVDENGLVHGVGYGTAEITAAASNGVTARLHVTVCPPSALILPAGIARIEAEAFMGAACQAVILPDGCEEIGSRAFAHCQNLTYVLVPASVALIAEDAFEGSDQAVIDRLTE